MEKPTRTLESLTDEELIKLRELTCPQGTGWFNRDGLEIPMSHYGDHISFKFMYKILSCLDNMGIDYKS